MTMLNRRAAEAQAAGGELILAISGFRSLRTAHAWLHGPIQRRSWRRVRAAARLGAECVPQREPDHSLQTFLTPRPRMAQTTRTARAGDRACRQTCAA